jgi:hypothetical protein
MKRIMTRVLPAFFFLTVSAATAFAQGAAQSVPTIDYETNCT